MPVYSHSRLGTFEKCPLQYRYRYIDRIKRDVQGIEAYLGNRVHDTLEFLFRELGRGRRPELETLLGRFHEGWKAGYSDRIRIVKKEFQADHYRRIGERCIENYYRSHRPFEQDATVGLEERVLIALDPAARYQVQGYIDRLAKLEEGVYVVHDYKTSGSLPTGLDLRRDRQLSFYEMGVRQRYPDAREIRLVWHYLAFDQDLDSRRTPAELDEHRRRAIRLIDTIEAAREHPPRESPLCRWCDYRDICPAQAEQYRAEQLAAAAPPAAASPAKTAADPPARKPSSGESGRAGHAPSGRGRQLELFP